MRPNEIKKVLFRYKKAYGQIPDWAEIISEIMPELLEPWLLIRSRAIENGELSRKVKELILLGINLVRNYQAGVETHLRGALDSGASIQEIMETIALSIISSAAPVIYNGPRTLRTELIRRKKIKNYKSIK